MAVAARPPRLPRAESCRRACRSARGNPIARAAAAGGARRPGHLWRRRGFSYDGPTADGRPDAGLLFAAYQADAATAFVPVQARLAHSDVVNLWTTDIGSAAFAVPTGCAPGRFVGQELLDT